MCVTTNYTQPYSLNCAFLPTRTNLRLIGVDGCARRGVAHLLGAIHISVCSPDGWRSVSGRLAHAERILKICRDADLSSQFTSSHFTHAARVGLQLEQFS